MNFFDTKNFSLRREVVKRFLVLVHQRNQECGENKLSTMCLQKSDKVIRVTHVRHFFQNHWNKVRHFLLWTHIKLRLLIYNYLLIALLTPTQ